MTLQEAIKQYQKAQEESAAAYKALQAAREAKEAARIKAREEYQTEREFIFAKDESSPAYMAYKAAQDAERAAYKKDNTTTAIRKAAGDNVLNVAVNTLRAAILANPEKFNKPVHFKKFIENVKEITGPRFYIDNSLSCSFYINYIDMDHGSNSAFICGKNNGLLEIEPEKLQQAAPEFTLKQIKSEARKAEKDAEKLRKAAARLEATCKETRAQYDTYIRYLLPDYSCDNFRDSKLF